MKNIQHLNQCLPNGNIEQSGLFPRLDELADLPYVLEIDFGLNQLPTEPGILNIRGARQYDKSNWLEKRLNKPLLSWPRQRLLSK